MNETGLSYEEVVDNMLAGKKGFGNITDSKIIKDQSKKGKSGGKKGARPGFDGAPIM